MKFKYMIIFILFLDNIFSSDRAPLPPGLQSHQEEFAKLRQHVLSKLEMMESTIRQYMQILEQRKAETDTSVKSMQYYQILAASTNKKLSEHDEFINDFRRVLNQQAEFIINLQRRFDSLEKKNNDLHRAIESNRTLYEVLRSDIGAIKVDSSAIKKEIDKLFENRLHIEARIKNIEQYLPLMKHLKETLFLKLENIDTLILDLQSRIAMLEKSRESNNRTLRQGALSLNELIEKSRAQLRAASS